MPLQKASSDHYGYTKNGRAQWQRSRSSGYPQPQTSRPLVPVSEKTKSKLNQFQFLSKTDASPDASHTNPAERYNTDGEQDSYIANNTTSATPRRPGLETEITPPGRVSLRDLLNRGPGHTDDDDADFSPEEKVGWDSTKPRNPDLASMMIPRKGRKRARSSSPVSSPAHTFFKSPSPPTIDRKKLTEALNSPHADPTLQLWDRLAMGSKPSVDTPLSATSVGLAKFMISSSPRPPKDKASSARSLRRTMSSGLSWPKRRRLDKSESTGSTKSAQNPDNSCKSSLVSALLDTVESRQTSNVDEMDHSPSVVAASPSPSKRRMAAPPRTEFPPPPRMCDMTSLAQAPSKSGSVLKQGKQPDPGDSDSDYGDDVFLDDDTLMQLEATVMAAAQPSAPSVPAPQNNKPTADADEEDFDDLDDDNILEAAANMMADLEGATGLCKPTNMPGNQQATDDHGDDFGEDDFGNDFDFDAAEMAATQSAKPTSQHLPPATASQKPRTIQRYLVTNVLENEYINGRGQRAFEKILLVQVENTKSNRTVHLRGDWFETPAHAKAYIHIIGDFNPEGRCIIDDDRNMLILHPDQLISATVVADSFTCMRRAVLQDRVKATSEATAPLVYGTILHEIFQAALLANQWDGPYLSTVIDKILDKHVEDLYKIKVGPYIAKEHLQSKMPELSGWADAFVASQPKDSAVVLDRNGRKANMCVSKLLDVEEHVWSPMYGLKGNIDATVQVTMKDGEDTRVLTVPFEVKTGKNANSSHMAQTALYNLLLSDRYDIEIVYGILYYMESSQTTRIPAIRHELRHMIMQRNQLACHIRERSVQLPPMKKAKHMCGKCYAKSSCFIYHRLADDGDGVSSGMDAKFDEVVGHLTPTHRDFFIKWENLLTKEEKESQKLRRELWTMVSKDREKLGRAFADVVIEEGSWSEDLESPSINRFCYTFIKREHTPGHSFMESQLATGEPIVISDEQGHFALALGYVTSVRKSRISVAVDRRLHNARMRQPGFNEQTNQVFAGIMEVLPDGCQTNPSQGNVPHEPIRYRLDKDEFSNGMATVRNNLVQVMASDVFGAREIRRLVVDLVPPRFKAESTQYELVDQDMLNVDQHKAIQKVMSAQDYALVLGMPGTGKTTTIAHIIRALTSQGKSVLLTSYTHTAVDNILLKLKNDSIPILRLGAAAKVHPEVQEFVTLASQPMHSFDEIKDAWHGTPIVATTCLGIGHPVFNERTFDYCIVDEASQITLPICLGPIRMAKTFILVGDHNQLPPLVQNEEAREGGLDVSLFKLLSDTHPESVVNLEHQYRMCEDIMTLSNTLIYKGRLKCGTEQLRRTKLEIPNMSALKFKHFDSASFLHPGTPRSFCRSAVQGSCWLRDLLEPEARVRFINTDTLQPRAREEAKGNRIVNPREAQIVVQLVDALVTTGVPESEIGVMTHYRSQLSLLKYGLRGSPGVEMHTADRFQGRDKEVVVLSLVRSNEACAIGDLLRDWRRINVAFTRAKTKLLVVGSRETLKGAGKDEMLSRFVGLMEEREWTYDLPGDALECHMFDDAGTQITASAARSPLKSKSTGGLKSPRKGAAGGLKSPRSVGKENQRPQPKRVTAGERVLTKNRPVTRDILNEMMNGGY